MAPFGWVIIPIFTNRDTAMTAIRLAVLLLLSLLLACGREAGDTSSVPLASESAQATAFGSGPWLRDRLPPDTIAYLRLPSPWRSALGPAGKTNDRMFQSQAWVDAVARMRADMGKDPLSGEAAIPLTGLLHRLGSPVEIAVVAAGRIASPAANVYATLALDYADAAALGKVLGEAMGGTAVTFDAEGFASVPDAGAPVFLHFDAASKRLSVLGGMFANLDSLKSLRKTIAEAKVEPRAELGLEREIDAHLGGRTPTLADLAKPPYALMVFKEAMRRYPPAYVIARRALRDVEIAGRHIPKGHLVVINIIGMHHDPALFRDPEVFDPERFTPEAEKALPKHAFLPFGAGPASSA